MKESFLLNKCSTHLSMQCSCSGSDPSTSKFWIRPSFDSKLVSQDSAEKGISQLSVIEPFTTSTRENHQNESSIGAFPNSSVAAFLGGKKVCLALWA